MKVKNNELATIADIIKTTDIGVRADGEVQSLQFSLSGDMVDAMADAGWRMYYVSSEGRHVKLRVCWRRKNGKL